MWKNREFYNGLSVLPYFGGNYVQAPFEDITKDESDAVFVGTIIAIAQHMKLSVVAEGVESKAELEFLTDVTHPPLKKRIISGWKK